MKRFSIPLLCLIVSAAILSLTSCQKDNVKKLSGTQWRSEGLGQPLALEFLSDTDVQLYFPDGDKPIKEGLKEGTYSIVQDEIVFEEGALFFEDRVTAISKDVTHYFQKGKLVKGELRVTARTITVEYTDPLDHSVVKSTQTSESHYNFEKR